VGRVPAAAEGGYGLDLNLQNQKQRRRTGVSYLHKLRPDTPGPPDSRGRLSLHFSNLGWGDVVGGGLVEPSGESVQEYRGSEHCDGEEQVAFDGAAEKWKTGGVRHHNAVEAPGI